MLGALIQRLRRLFGGAEVTMLCPVCRRVLHDRHRRVPGSSGVLEYRCLECRAESIWAVHGTKPMVRRWRRPHSQRWYGPGW